jgi:hypothetical protein
MSGRTAYLTACTPVLGCALLAVLAVTKRLWFDALVREDSVLEWAEVCAYGAAAVAGALVAYRARGLVRAAYGLLSVAAIAAIGEELSWGQRLFGVTTPEPVAAANRQEELNFHNLAAVDSKTRLVLLAAALYGAVVPLVRRRPSPFVPPRVVVPAFAVVAVYFGIRFAFFAEPTYAQAKFSEWPELCFAAAVALTAYSTLRRCEPRVAGSTALTFAAARTGPRS